MCDKKVTRTVSFFICKVDAIRTKSAGFFGWRTNVSYKKVSLIQHRTWFINSTRNLGIGYWLFVCARENAGVEKETLTLIPTWQLCFCSWNSWRRRKSREKGKEEKRPGIEKGPLPILRKDVQSWAEWASDADSSSSWRRHLSWLGKKGRARASFKGKPPAK